MSAVPPELMQPPPRHPSGMSRVAPSRLGLGLRMLGGVWTFVVVLIALMALRGYLKSGEADLVVAGAIAGFVGVALTVAIGIGLVLAHGRVSRLYQHGVLTTGRVRSAQPGLSADHPASIEVDFQDGYGRPGLGTFSIAWTKASWLTPGALVPAMYSPHEGALFGVYLNGIGLVLGHRRT